MLIVNMLSNYRREKKRDAQIECQAKKTGCCQHILFLQAFGREPSLVCFFCLSKIQIELTHRLFTRLIQQLICSMTIS